MKCFKASDDGFKKPMFDNFENSSLKKQVNMASVNGFVCKSYPIDLQRDFGQYSSDKLFQSRNNYLVGGFVGSKICENKSGSLNYSDVLGQIIFFKPGSPQTMLRKEETWTRNPPMIPPSYAQVVTSAKVVPPASPKIVISSPIVVKPIVSPVSSPKMPNQTEATLSPVVCRTISESSDSSWASVDPTENRNDLLSGNEYLRNLVVCVSDSDDSDDDSEWDCVEDYQSENGEVINDLKWNGDSLSPISSPVSRTPPTPSANLDGYDSDESDGILISCGHGYVFDDEEEERERRLIEERLEDANRRWEENLQETTDQPDGISKTDSLKKVQFAPNNKLARIRPMITWKYAYRAARKGEWERLARDTVRFRERIDKTAVQLAPILDPAYRERIRQKYFETTDCGEPSGP